MFCTKCGSPLKDGSKFCIKCGAQVSGIVPPEQPVLQQAPQPAPQPAPAPAYQVPPHPTPAPTYQVPPANGAPVYAAPGPIYQAQPTPPQPAKQSSAKIAPGFMIASILIAILGVVSVMGHSLVYRLNMMDIFNFRLMGHSGFISLFAASILLLVSCILLRVTRIPAAVSLVLFLSTFLVNVYFPFHLMFLPMAQNTLHIPMFLFTCIVCGTFFAGIFTTGKAKRIMSAVSLGLFAFLILYSFIATMFRPGNGGAPMYIGIMHMRGPFIYVIVNYSYVFIYTCYALIAAGVFASTFKKAE